LGLSQCNREVLNYLVKGRLVGRIFKGDKVKYIQNLVKEDQFRSSVSAEKIDKKRKNEEKALRYHKWKLVCFIVENSFDKLSVDEKKCLCELNYTRLMQIL
jgi:hypothetical protein